MVKVCHGKRKCHEYLYVHLKLATSILLYGIGQLHNINTGYGNYSIVRVAIHSVYHMVKIHP